MLHLGEFLDGGVLGDELEDRDDPGDMLLLLDMLPARFMAFLRDALTDSINDLKSSVDDSDESSLPVLRRCSARARAYC